MTKYHVFNIISEIFELVEEDDGYIAQFYDFIDEDKDDTSEDYKKIRSEFWHILEEKLL